ncbi:MerR family transcriptional regulator [Vagococcus acidifermentans]|uniref:HTH merR-type domain-containing protein n=1 Tax=Vagococcus acidifermentans TaxID=564710 RepID=A0A430AMG5_9ENTE|nr:MerR family transcriptional regulator [Vagococcus acidifermentans]RSU09322.1 hypothetical protein CBF27_12980 [Vagococcus acidifermentans]
MNDLLKIGKFAKLNNISVQTLRYYESIGLLHPVTIDSETGYRYYNILQSSIIDMIQFLKNFNFSLEEIKLILENKEDMDQLFTQVIKKELALLQEKRRIDSKLKMIREFNEANLAYRRNVDNQSFELIRFPERKIITFDTRKNIYDMSSSEYELALREFKYSLSRKASPLNTFSRVGSIMTKENFSMNHFVSKRMFLMSEWSENQQTQTAVFPEGSYAIAYCSSFAEELKALSRFKLELAGRRLQIGGDYICEVIYEIPYATQIHRNMFIRMQVPVIMQDDRR